MSENENRNRRPEESSKLPYLSLAVLVIIIAGLLYAGYAHLADAAPELATGFGAVVLLGAVLTQGIPAARTLANALD